MEPEHPFEFLAEEPAPLMLLEALKHYGTREIPGEEHNARIMGWAEELASLPGFDKVRDDYHSDEVAWCGLFMGIVAHRAGKPVQDDLLWSRGWLDWGNAVEGDPVLGDVLVFWRGSPEGWKGHVGMYVGEDDEHFYVLGGNQGNRVCIVKKLKSQLLKARNYYRIGQPENCRRIFITADGPVSTDEA